MSSYNIICRLGSGEEQVSVKKKNGVQVDIRIDPASKTSEYGFNSILSEIAELGIVPGEVAIDWLLIAILVSAADTRIGRKKIAQDNWTREIDLYIPVSDPARWSKHEQLLANTLRFLTGDHWRFIFRSRQKKYLNLANDTKSETPKDITEVCLFSGGLDSFIGAVDLLSDGHKPLFVSHYGDPETSAAQNRCLEAISTRYGKDSFYSFRVGTRFPKNLISGTTEDTTRGRSFLFYALALLAASGRKKTVKIIIPENGLIALNIPLDKLRLGSLSTRTAHPYFIARINQLASAMGIKTTLTNSYRHMTKGEMIASCKDKKFLRKNLSLTMSCSDPKKNRWLGLSPGHCGYCLPCLIRKAAVQHGFGNYSADAKYQLNFSNRILDSKKAEGINVRSFQIASKRLASNPDLAKVLVHKSGPLTDKPDEITGYEELYKRGMKEIDVILKNVKTKPK